MSTDLVSIVVLSTLAGLGTGLGGLSSYPKAWREAIGVLDGIGCWNHDYAIVLGASL